MQSKYQIPLQHRGDIQNERPRRSQKSNTNIIGVRVLSKEQKVQITKSKKYWRLVQRALLVEYIDLGIENTASLIFLAGQQWSFPFYFISFFLGESLALNREGEELAQTGPRSGLEEEGMGK